jgi:hypothetical protein
MSVNENCEAFSDICADVRPYKSAIVSILHKLTNWPYQIIINHLFKLIKSIKNGIA